MTIRFSKAYVCIYNSIKDDNTAGCNSAISASPFDIHAIGRRKSCRKTSQKRSSGKLADRPTIQAAAD